MTASTLTNVDGHTPRETPEPVPQPAREAAIRPFARPGPRYWILAATLAAVVSLGVFAWVIQLRRGLGVAGYNDHAFWAIYIADVVTFIGVSYGGAVVSAILRLTGSSWRAPLSRLAEGMAVVTVLVGAAFIVPHLGRPERAWELVTRPNLSSPIFWDFVAIGTYTIGSIIFFALPLVPDMAILHKAHRDKLGRRAWLYRAISRGWIGSPRQRGVLRGALGLVAIMIIPLAVAVHSVLSWAFALVSRPWWHESIWAPYFVVAALYSGVALVILVVAGFRRAYHLEAYITERHFVRLGYIMATFAAGYLYLTFADILPDAYTGQPEPTAIFQQLLIGRYAPWFWTFAIAAGLVPLMLIAIRRTRTVRGIVVAAALVVPAMWLKRMLMVVEPSNYDRITHTFGAYHFTWISVSITLAGVAAIPLLLMLLFRVVPLMSIDEMEQFAGPPADGARPASGSGSSAGGVSTARSPATAPDGSQRRSRLPATGALALLVPIATALVLAHPAPAHAAVVTQAPAAPPATIQLTGVEGADGVLLTATLTGTNRVPVAGASVQFSQYTTEFGAKGQLVPLGSAATDHNGHARLTDRPAVTGTLRYVASYAHGTGTDVAPVSGSVDVAVTTAYPVYRPAPAKPLAAAGKALVGVLLATVGLILLTLLVQVERVRRVCRHPDSVNPRSPAQGTRPAG